MKTHFNCQQGLKPECGRLCSNDQVSHLLTRLELIEGSILERLEQEKYVALRELMVNLGWEPCAVSMAVGSLARQGLIELNEYEHDVFVEFVEQPDK